jgi:hypothetical protein
MDSYKVGMQDATIITRSSTHYSWQLGSHYLPPIVDRSSITVSHSDVGVLAPVRSNIIGT